MSVADKAVALGLPCFPCKSDKRPVTQNGFKDATDNPSAIRRLFAPRAAGLIGVPTGQASGFIVVDIDRGEDRDGADWLEANAYRIPPTRTHQTGGGGMHLLFTIPSRDVRNSHDRIAAGVDVRAEGGYVIFPPSKGYSIIDESPIAEMPEWLLDIVSPIAQPRHAAEPVKLRASESEDGSRYGLTALDRECGNINAAGFGNQEASLGGAGLKIGALVAGGELREGPALAALLSAARNVPSQPGKPAWGRGETEDVVRRAFERGKQSPRSAPPRHEPVRQLRPVHQADPNEKHDTRWTAGLQTNDKGAVIDNLHNVVMALQTAPQLVGCVAYDEMQRTAVLTQPMPNQAERVPCEVTDIHVSGLQLWLQAHGDMPRVGKDNCNHAIDLVAHNRRYHPVRDYLNGLQWDGVSRVRTWLNRYIGADDTPYTRAIGQMFLIAMVARIMNPGCKADYMIVLEGPQGARKSSACRALAGIWFTDDLPDIQSKDASQTLNGKWLIEVAELSAWRRAEANALKAFLTRAVERYRPAYAKRDVVEPRQCVFIGTTNKDTYLQDETGGRRFWPVRVGVIDVDGLTLDRDHLMAEAMALYQDGEVWWPDDAFEREHIAPQQEKRFEVDAWEEAIVEWLGRTGDDKTTADVAVNCLGMNLSKLGKVEERRIGAIMTRLGMVQRKSSGKRFWCKSSSR